MVMNVSGRRGRAFFDLSDPTFTIRLIATFQFLYNTNNIHEDAVILNLLFVKHVLAATLNISMFTAAHITPVLALVTSTEHQYW